jgi:P4 family phage/plasmid primase-like protien
MSSGSKRRDLEPNPKLEELGITGVCTIDKNLILSINERTIHSRLDNGDLEKTGKSLRHSLDKSTNFTYHDKEIICIEVSKMLLDSLLSEQQTKERNQEQGQKEESNHEGDYLDLPDELKETFHLKTIGHDKIKEIYYYNPNRGIYLNNGNTIIATELEKRYTKELEDFRRLTLGLTEREIEEMGLKSPKPWTRKTIDELIGHIERRTHVEIPALNHDIEWLACEDYMINLLTGETSPFDPKYLNTTQIPVKYNVAERNPVIDFWHYCVMDPLDASSPCPKIMKFLHQIVPPEDVEIILDFLAYCLWRQYKYHVWILFNGSGQNGKSTLLTLIERFLGHSNVSGESLDRLLNNNFAPASLFQKLANIDADLSGDIISRHTGKLKKLTGSDEYPAEFKYKSAFKFRNHAKLIFSCNEIPECNDRTDAFFRRLIIINFKQQFFGNKENPNLINELVTDEEFSGLLHELLRRLPRVLYKGIRPTTNESMRDTYDKYLMSSNPIKYFSEKGISREMGCVVTKELMYDSYCWYCREKGLSPESEQSFSRKMTQDHGYEVKRIRMNGKNPYYYVDVKLLDWNALEDKEQDTLDIGRGLTEAEKEAMK